MKKLLGLVIGFVFFLHLASGAALAQSNGDGIVSMMGGILGGAAWCQAASDYPAAQLQCDTSVQAKPGLERWWFTVTPGDDGQVSDPGLLNYAGSATVALISNPPAHTSEYIADVGRNLGIVQPVYAQGFGFGALRPILGIWKAFRNIAYGFFTIVFVVIGFAIMLRQKLNPQTVVNIQSALPKLIVTLILITFSYAIAGLVIDLMYLAIFFMISVAKTYLFVNNGEKVLDLISGVELGDDFSIEQITLGFNIIQTYASFIFFGPVGKMADSINGVLGSIIGEGNVLHFLWDILGIDTIGKAVFWVIITLALVVQMFRTFFALLGCYIQIILSIIFAPLQISMNALPGNNAFSKWLRNLFANVAVFPVLVAMIIITLALLGQGTQPGIGFSGNTTFGAGTGAAGALTYKYYPWSKTDTSGFSPPQLPHSNADAAQGIIAIGMCMLYPEVVKLTKKALQVEDSGMSQAAMGNLASGTALPRKAWGLGTGMYKSEEDWKKQARFFGVPEESPYQAKGAPKLKPHELWAARAKEAARRTVGA